MPPAVSKPRRRRGLSLLELVIASALMTTVVTAVALLVRGMHASWQANDADGRRLEAAHAVARHIVRKARQADAVTSLSPAADSAGSLSLLMTDGSTLAWSRNSATDEVFYGTGVADQLLAEDITELSFTGYKADGVTTTTVPAEVQALKCRVGVELPRDTSGTRVVDGWVWLRSF